MGLAVAYQLVKEGHQPVVFEADDRVGGMAAAFDFAGLSIERYYHFHCTSDRCFLQMLDELGLSGKMHWVATKMAYWYRGEVQPWGNPLALLRFRGLGLAAKGSLWSARIPQHQAQELASVGQNRSCGLD